MQSAPEVINVNISKTIRELEKIHTEQNGSNRVLNIGLENFLNAENVDVNCEDSR